MRDRAIPRPVTWEWVEREIARHLQMAEGERRQAPSESVTKLFEERGPDRLPRQYQRGRESGKRRRI
jgi:hypothetical protein